MEGQAIRAGGCLCGAIRFEAVGPAEYPHTCSCEMCRRHTGCLTAVRVVFPREAVRWTGEGGEPELYRASDFSSRAFCRTCGSTIGAVDDAPTVGILVGALDDTHAEDLKPVEHSFADARPIWWDVRMR